MPKALVLGGSTGMLGQALVNALTKNGWQTASLGRGDGDIFKPEFLEKTIVKNAPDAIFNTIAWTQVDAAEDNYDSADAVNRIFPAMLASILARYENIWLCHYSTDFVFSEPAHIPWKESDVPQPSSVYGATKLEGENAVLQKLPDRSCVIRTAWLYGPGKKNFITTILKLCKEKDSINVVDDQFGSPTFTCDLAEWSCALANARATGLWHGVNSGIASWCEFANEATELSGYSCRVKPITSNEWPQKAKRPAFSALDNSKLTAFLGKKPRPWPQALRDYIFHSCEEISGGMDH